MTRVAPMKPGAVCEQPRGWALALKPGHRCQQLALAGRSGLPINGLALTLPFDLAGAHNSHAVAYGFDSADVVGDKQVADAQLALQVMQQVQDLRLHRRVRRRRARR